jgi:formylglycine-generating enzyme required for sulfatase activity
MNKKTWVIGLPLVILLALIITVLAYSAASGHVEAQSTTTTSTPAPISAGSSNDDWTPVVQEFGGVEMVFVPAGCFVMGSDDSPFSNEGPAHEVCLDAFWIDRYEVTNGQFAAFDGQAALAVSIWSESDRPRNSIRWYEAHDFCESRGARLPTEAEWEYAARGPEGWIYPWGDDFVPENVVYVENSGRVTAAVGSRSGDTSWVGALDMSGNVGEWVVDLYAFDYYSTLEDGVLNPTGPKEVTRHVEKGGSYAAEWVTLHASIRGGDEANVSLPELGFRCARSE